MCSASLGRLLAAFIGLVALPEVLLAQADSTRADTAGLGVHVSFGVAPFTLKEPAVLRAPWAAAPRLPPGARASAWDSTVAVALDSARQERRAGLRSLVLYGQPEPEPEAGVTPTPESNVLGLSKKYADLALDGQVRLELRTDRLRNERCGAAQLLDPNSGCRGGFKPPRLDNQVNVRSSGILGERVHLAVDYDTERDFSANNNVQVYYQGLEDEIVRRIEVGTVTFQPPQSRFLTAAIPANNFGVNAR
ncbi:MAG TPA: hypothetical protein VHK68_12085, partial [Gemmatimonadales bacterium]|nr:hypothetical protein [Gemmatimonadales bacterium]